jgi:hypothetical protein
MAYNNPANAAMPYLQQIPGTITPYYQPYVDAGSQALSQLMSQYQTLLTNPSQVMNMLGSSYQQSPGYQYQMTAGQNAENSAAASGGMLGTPYHQEESATMAEQIANQDYQQYLNQMMRLYGMGLEGEQGINQMGYGASNELAQALAANLMNEGGMAYAGAAGQNAYDQMQKNQQQSFWDSLISGGASLISGLF